MENSIEVVLTGLMGWTGEGILRQHRSQNLYSGLKEVPVVCLFKPLRSTGKMRYEKASTNDASWDSLGIRIPIEKAMGLTLKKERKKKENPNKTNNKQQINFLIIESFSAKL